MGSMRALRSVLLAVGGTAAAASIGLVCLAEFALPESDTRVPALIVGGLAVAALAVTALGGVIAMDRAGRD